MQKVVSDHTSKYSQWTPIQVDGHDNATKTTAEDDLDVVWTRTSDIVLTQRDKKVITNHQCLTDKHINFAQRIIHQQFSVLSGLQLTVLQQNPFQGKKDNYLQIIHIRSNHWVLISSTKGKVVNVYDSLYTSLDEKTAKVIQNLLKCSLFNIKMIPVQKQVGITDCALFAIAFATAKALGRDPSKEVFDQGRMRTHLIECFENKIMESFP